MKAVAFTGCRQCGACCRVEGDVRLRPGEADAIAASLDMPVYDFTATYTRLTGDRVTLSLTEKEDGSCIFLDDERCVIDAVKPRQCREFPRTWHFEGWQELCHGVRREGV